MNAQRDVVVVPAIDLIGGNCVRLLRGDYAQVTRYTVSPVEQALAFQRMGFRRLHLVDLDGSRGADADLNRRRIEEIALAVSVPIQAGGGVRTTEDVDRLLAAGVEFIIVSTVALEEPDLFSEWVSCWGSGRFIVSLDLRKDRLGSRGWTRESDRTLEELRNQIVEWDLGQVICTDIEKDGTLSEPAYATTRFLRGLFPEGVSILVAGGVSRPQQVAVLRTCGASGVIVGRALYEGNSAPEEFLRAG